LEAEEVLEARMEVLEEPAPRFFRMLREQTDQIYQEEVMPETEAATTTTLAVLWVRTEDAAEVLTADKEETREVPPTAQVDPMDAGEEEQGPSGAGQGTA
jgi:hypothetical protein